MNHQYDCLVIGAGLAGSVAARELAERSGKQVLVLERRNHVGGNAYDCFDEAEVLIRQYGPHIFHTNSTRVFDHLSRSTRWRSYEHQVMTNLPNGDGWLERPVPFNLVSLRAAFPPEKTRALTKRLVSVYGMEKKITILELRQNPDPELSILADYVYDHISVRYTMKQQGQTPGKIDPNTTARMPVSLSGDCRYFQDAYQGMPLEGYTPMFQSLLDRPDIAVELGVDAASRLTPDGGATLLDGRSFSGPIIYTGVADELFGCKYGHLPYRTLDLRFETHPVDSWQSHRTVSYTVGQNCTRITEFKYLTEQELLGQATIMKEYPRVYVGVKGEIPHYAVINTENNALHAKYRVEADRYPNSHLLGRLAEYRYYNMDAITARALEPCDDLLK